MNTELPYWRSLLFVPANQDRFIDGASRRNADAYVLDLEDSVPLSEKAATRDGLQDAVARLSSFGVEVLVRINRPWRLALRDIEASVSDGVTALALPKVPDPGYVCAVSEILEELEAELPQSRDRCLTSSPSEDILASTPRDLCFFYFIE